MESHMTLILSLCNWGGKTRVQKEIAVSLIKDNMEQCKIGTYPMHAKYRMSTAKAKKKVAE